MVKLVVPTLDEISKKWVDETPRRSVYYEKNAPAAAPRWAANAIAAEAVYKAAITAPGVEKRYAGGIKRVGAPKYERKIKEVGVARFGPGVTAAKLDFENGIKPYRDELAAIDIPTRKPRGDPGNLDRVRAIMEALHKKRLAILAVSPSAS